MNTYILYLNLSILLNSSSTKLSGQVFHSWITLFTAAQNRAETMANMYVVDGIRRSSVKVDLRSFVLVI